MKIVKKIELLTDCFNKTDHYAFEKFQCPVSDLKSRYVTKCIYKFNNILDHGGVIHKEDFWIAESFYTIAKGMLNEYEFLELWFLNPKTGEIKSFQITEIYKITEDIVNKYLNKT